MNYTQEVENMCIVKKGPNHGPAPIPEEGKWVKAYEIKDISGILFVIFARRFLGWILIGCSLLH